jgi:hypothetical protein
MKIKKIIQYILFLTIGIFIFWWIYKDLPVEELKGILLELKYEWVVLSIVFGITAHFLRAVRWNMLIHPLGYRPKKINSFLAVLILYMTNLVIPRAGEVARCTVLAKYEDIPASKLIGTVVIERFADVIALFSFAVIIILTNLEVVSRFFEAHPAIYENILKFLSVKYIIASVAVLIIFFLLIIVFKSHLKKNRIVKKIILLKNEFVEGIKSISRLKNTWLFIGHTVLIYLMYLLMLYVVFFAYEPTQNLSLQVALVTFLMGGLAMLAPVQAGIGPWHFMVIETLILYGIDKYEGKVFALIAHTSTNMIYLVIGVIAFILLPVINTSLKPKDENQESNES